MLLSCGGWLFATRRLLGPLWPGWRAPSLRANALARLPCGVWLAKMERISEVLQCPVMVEGRGPGLLEPQLLEKFEGRADALFPLPRGPTRLLNQMMLITSTELLAYMMHLIS